MSEPDVLLMSTVLREVKLAEPLGVSYLASSLRHQGLSAEIINPLAHGWTAVETAEAIMNHPGKIIGLSVHRDKNKADVFALLEHLRNNGDQRFVCLGGHGPTVGIPWEQSRRPYALPPYVELMRLADACILGEAEVTFVKLVRAVLSGQEWQTLPGVCYLCDGELHINPCCSQPDLDELPFMARDVLAELRRLTIPAESASLCLSRGCMYNCSFCSVRAFTSVHPGKKYRRRKIDNVIAEMIEIHDRFGIVDFNFEDDCFVERSQRGIELIHEFCSEVDRLDFRPRFTIFCRPDVVTLDTFQRLTASGLSGVYLGIESIVAEDLSLFNKKLTTTQIRQALSVLASLGFSPAVGAERRIMIGFITWHPYSNIGQLRQAVDFVRSYQAPAKLLQRAMRLYPGAPLHDQLQDLGLLDPDFSGGWRYELRGLEHVEQSVKNFFTKVLQLREPLRTVEKTLVRCPDIRSIPRDHVQMLRAQLDKRCIDYVKSVIDVFSSVQAHNNSEIEAAIIAYEQNNVASLNQFSTTSNIQDVITTSYSLLGLHELAQDLYRK